MDVGSGSGYLTVCFAKMVGPTGKVVGIDHIKELVNWSESNVKKNNGDLLASGQIKLVVGDGRQGYAQDGPYHAIHVGAAAPTLPQALVEQLGNILIHFMTVLYTRWRQQVWGIFVISLIFCDFCEFGEFSEFDDLANFYEFGNFCEFCYFGDFGDFCEFCNFGEFL